MQGLTAFSLSSSSFCQKYISRVASPSSIQKGYTLVIESHDCRKVFIISKSNFVLGSEEPWRFRTSVLGVSGAR